MSLGAVTFWFVLGCMVFFIAAVGFFSTLLAKPQDYEVKIVEKQKDKVRRQATRRQARLRRPA